MKTTIVSNVLLTLAALLGGSTVCWLLADWMNRALNAVSSDVPLTLGEPGGLVEAVVS